MPGSDLKGCVNDVTNVRDVLLKYFGFEVEDIRLLVDERATKKGILERLKWLVQGAKKGDRLLFHFSGHGSQVRDRDEDEVKDHLDEILCPHDMDWDDNFIVDDELKGIFAGLADGIVLEVLLDSCHSGTGTREAMGLRQLPEEMRYTARFLQPPADILARVEDELPMRHLLRGGEVNSAKASQGAVPPYLALFTGCRDNQTSADAMIGGKYNGAFTYYFCKHLRDVKGEITRAEQLRRVRASLKYNDFEQVPQLEAGKGKRGKRVME
jgi:hypothetical protein